MACIKMATSSRSMFGSAVSQILNSWTALQLAVEHGFGGSESREKAEWMVLAIETWFRENDGIEPDEVEDFLEDVLNAEFDLKVEDNSIPEISRSICLYFRLCQENKVEELQQRLQALPRANLQGSRQGDEEMDGEVDDDPGPSSSTSSSSQQSATTLPQPPSTSDNAEEMEITDEQPAEGDGWQVIRRGKKKK